MKTIRLCHFVTALIVSALAMHAQIFNPDRPMIREFVISVDSINAQLKKYQHPQQNPIWESDGSVQIPSSYYIHNGKSMGIIVVRTQSYSYQAFDARYSHCFYDNEEPRSKVKMTGNLFARCDVCGAEVHNLVLTGSGQMCRYDDEMQGYVYLDGYTVDVIKKGKKKYLLISNPPNGVRNEWMRQPENQPLLENGRPYKHPMAPNLNGNFRIFTISVSKFDTP